MQHLRRFLQVLILKELGELQEACAICLLEKAGKTPGQLVAGGGRNTNKGAKKEKIPREGGLPLTSTYYKIWVIFVKDKYKYCSFYEIAKSWFRDPQASSESWLPEYPDSHVSRCLLVPQVTEDSVSAVSFLALVAGARTPAL